MKNYKEIVDVNVWQKVWNNISNRVYNVCNYVDVIGWLDFSNNMHNHIWITVFNNVGRNVRDNVEDNHNLFQNNSLKQYKDNL